MSERVTRRDLLQGTVAVAAGAGGTLGVWAPISGAATPRPASATGESAVEGALRQRLAPIVAHHHIAGLGLAVTRNSSGAALGMGSASLPFAVPVTPRTLFHIASVGKHFTAAAVLQLAGEKRFALDEPIGRYLTDIPDAWAARPIASLLHHTSGIPDYEGNEFDETKPHTRAEVIAAAAAKPMLFETGRTWAYSNMNYMLLGWLIEAASGRPYAKFITERVLQPAGLVDARVDAAEEIIVNRAEPYLWQPSNRTYRHAIRMENAYSGYPDGPLLISAEDSLRWDAALANHKVLSPALWRTMLEPARLASGLSVPYASAWFVESTRARAIHSHTGGLPGFTAFFLRMPESGVSVMVLTNVRLFGSRVQRYIGHLAAETVAPGSTMLSLTPARDDRPDLTTAARGILLRGNKPVAREALAPELRLIVDGPSGERGIANRPVDLTGEPTGFDFIEQRTLGSATLRRYRMTYTDLVEHIVVGYTPEEKIYWVSPD